MNSFFRSTEELRNLLISNGFIGIHFCAYESGEQDIEHFQLLEPGQEVTDDCANVGKIPLISKEGEAILHRYLNTEIVKIHPEPSTLLTYGINL